MYIYIASLSGIATLTKLTLLDFGDNAFSGGIGSQIGSLVSLQRFDVNRNKFNGMCVVCCYVTSLSVQVCMFVCMYVCMHVYCMFYI